VILSGICKDIFPARIQICQHFLMLVCVVEKCSFFLTSILHYYGAKVVMFVSDKTPMMEKPLTSMEAC
jgi:hypothetical protein